MILSRSEGACQCGASCHAAIFPRAGEVLPNAVHLHADRHLLPTFAWFASRLDEATTHAFLNVVEDFLGLRTSISYSLGLSLVVPPTSFSSFFLLHAFVGLIVHAAY